jgi:hypothetical protein
MHTSPKAARNGELMSKIQLAHTTDFKFIDDLLSHGEEYSAVPGDTVEIEEVSEEHVISGELPDENTFELVSRTDGAATFRIPNTQTQVELSTEDLWMRVVASPTLSGIWDQHLRTPTPDGVAFADGLVSPELVKRLQADVDLLCDKLPVDHHPGSGTKVRDIVHPSLYPFVEGRSVLPKTFQKTVETSPDYDRFGRTYEESLYQWLPTPFQIGRDGSVTIASYINNLDRTQFGAVYDDLAALFSTALPLIESVVGYVEQTKFWHEDTADIEHEGELPEKVKRTRKKVSGASLHGKELLVIPKIVEYRLAANETHEGVWHVEGMSHEHIVATCVYILDRDDSLQGGDLSFKRAYTIEEAGLLFWNIDQCRPHPIEELVNEGTIPVGTVATSKGRLVVFPNSHIHKLNMLKVTQGAKEARRRVIVFWIVDPNVKIPSTREVAPQQGVIPHEEALRIRLELMEERRRHKQSLNVRAVSLCEH